ncbi:MAG: redox-regulated ATPase YchF [Candidatus Geothermincolia bacterium]
MSLDVGIIGLPNSGKTTIFNAITRVGANVASYAYATIDPNVGVVEVPDDRLGVLADFEKSAKLVPATFRFVDIAGLAPGASKGEGLGNQFLHHIREVDAVAHVITCFEDPNVVHVAEGIDPLRDIELLNMELIFADLATIDKRREKSAKALKSGDKEKQREMVLLDKVEAALSEGIMVKSMSLAPEEELILRDLWLLTAKPVIYVANLGEEQLADDDGCVAAIRDRAAADGSQVVAFCAKLEAEIEELSDEEAEQFLADYGISEPGLRSFLRASFELLDMITFFTAGPKETRAWPIRRGLRAPQAAGKIHTDMERGFIRAEVIGYEDFVNDGGYVGAKEAGHHRLEGKDYVVKDGDVMIIRFNV